MKVTGFVFNDDSSSVLVAHRWFVSLEDSAKSLSCPECTPVLAQAQQKVTLSAKAAQSLWPTPAPLACHGKTPTAPHSFLGIMVWLIHKDKRSKNGRRWGSLVLGKFSIKVFYCLNKFGNLKVSLIVYNIKSIYCDS